MFLEQIVPVMIVLLGIAVMILAKVLAPRWPGREGGIPVSMAVFVGFACAALGVLAFILVN